MSTWVEPDEKCPLGLVNISHYNSVVCKVKFTKFFWSNVERVIVDVFYRLSTWRSVLKIIAIKVESCQKSRRIFYVFSPSQILWGGPSKNGTHTITYALRHVEWKKFREDTPTSPEVIVANTLNFRPNFKFSPLITFFLGGGRHSWGVREVAWVNLLTRVKIWGGSTP